MSLIEDQPNPPGWAERMRECCWHSDGFIHFFSFLLSCVEGLLSLIPPVLFQLPRVFLLGQPARFRMEWREMARLTRRGREWLERSVVK